MQGLCHKITLDLRSSLGLSEGMAWRLLLKAGVYLDRLNRQPRKSLNKVVAIHGNYGYDLIITSTYEGTHSPGSFHYANNAYDISNPPDNKDEILRKIKMSLGKHFDIIDEGNHIHIEYDPK